jgi:hypothetical protein
MRVRLSAALFALLVLTGSSSALADSIGSSNWAGYAVHRDGTSFRTVQATWKQPSVTCTPGVRTFSSYWVGLGGYGINSQALEQIGTEVDCTRSGAVSSTAWYELVPAPSAPISLPVRPGDVLSAKVTVKGHRVSLSLRDLTTGLGFLKTTSVSAIDVSSAEWIVEAPSDCVSAGTCQTLPLADFGSVSFASARAQTVRGHRGSISSPAWGLTQISLTAGGRGFAANGFLPVLGTASPQGLSAGGTAFAVKYASVPVRDGTGAGLQGTLRSARLATASR